jgi:protein TonB
MIPRCVVPTNARIPAEQSNAPIAVRQDLLVPRNLIPANARISEEASSAASSAWESAAASRRLMVPRLLVPSGARVGTSVEPKGAGASPVTPVNVFDESLLGKSSLVHARSHGEWLISFGVHAALVAAVVIVPLFYTQVIDLRQFETTYLAAPLTPAPPPPPPPPAAVIPRQALRKILPTTAKLTMPTAVPKTIAAPSEAAEAASDIIAGVPGGVSGGQIGGVLGGILGGTGSSLPPPPPGAAAPVPDGPLHVGGDVKAPREIFKPPPKYPILALQAKIHGDVEIDAVIDKDGNVVQVRVISGPKLLIPAALECVKRWKYEPTYLNGVALPVELTVHVLFSIS